MQGKQRKQGKRALPASLLALLALFVILPLSACATLPDPETTQDFSAHTVAVVDAAHTVGQTFTARRPRLNGIDLWLAPDSPALLKVELFHSPEDPAPVFAGYVRAAEGLTRVAIPPLDDPPDQRYYLKLSADSGETGILGREEDAYADGTAFVDDQPVEADLAFRVTYEYDGGAARADLRRILTLWDVLLPLGLMLLLPGWLLLDLTALKSRFDFGERVALALGISLALIPLLMLWTSLVGLRWGRVSLWAGMLLLLGVVLWRRAYGVQGPGYGVGGTGYGVQGTGYGVQGTGYRVQGTGYEVLCTLYLPPSTLLAIFALALFLRFAMVRDLAAPAWVDSIHHGLITRLILEHGGHPGRFAPYLPAGADHYHFGFHSNLAAFIWLLPAPADGGNFPIHEAMLIFGQVLNALMVFPVYLLTKTLTRSRSAALTAALMVAAFTLMPAYYASWGRYTQLAGLLILPAALTLTLTVIGKQPSADSRQPSAIRHLPPAALTLAGLFLVHYRVTAFWGALLLAYLLFQVSPRKWLPAIGWLAVLGAAVFVLLLPWLPETLVNLLIPTGKKLSNGQAAWSGIPWGFLRSGLGIPALWMAGIGLALGLVLRRRFPFTVLAWTALLYLMANLGVFANVPGAGFINPVSMEITLFMPIAVLGGFAVGGGLEVVDRLTAFLARRVSTAGLLHSPSAQRDDAPPEPVEKPGANAGLAVLSGLPVLVRGALVLLGAWAGVLGAQRLLPTLNPGTFLAREADFPAIRWIDDNIPAGETILINPAAWGYGLYMGSDGGFWISALTAHPTLPPPVLYGMGTRAEREHVNAVVEAVQAAGSDPDALWEIMEAEGIRYVYLGARGGVISPRALERSARFAVRYHEGVTWVFERREAE